MRTLASVGAVTVAAAASLLLAAPTALATDGDKGTVKVHKSTTPQEDRRNEPKVCEFYLSAFDFDAAQDVTWKIVTWKPTGDNKTVAKDGSIVLDGEGNGRTTDMTLPDGHYKLFWNWEGENGSAKHKVFWVDCEDDATESPKPSDKPGEPSEKPSEDESVKPTGSNAPGAKGGDDGGSNLAETGASVAGATVAGALLIGAGGYLVLRRRNQQQH